MGSFFGGGGADSAAAGQMYSNAADQYQNINKNVNPFLMTQMNEGFSPQTYAATFNRTEDSSLQNIANLRKQVGSSVPNIAGQTGDALNSGVQATAGAEATLQGENQQYKDQAATQLAGNYSTEGQGFNQIGQDYQQAAQQAGNPFMSLLGLASSFFPGGQFANIISGISSMFGGGGGNTVGAGMSTDPSPIGGFGGL